MARPSVLLVEEKVRIVLAALAGELSTAAAARQAEVSEQSVSNWKQRFIKFCRAGLAAGSGRPSTREVQLLAEVADLTTAPGRGGDRVRFRGGSSSRGSARSNVPRRAVWIRRLTTLAAVHTR